METLFQIGLVFVLVLLNGFFVASEFALVAVRKTRIDELAKKGNAAAKHVSKALSNLDAFISATQLGITLASIALGWIGEPAIARLFEPLFHSFLPQSAAIVTSHSAAFVIAFSLITFLHIVFGELAPKSIALLKPEGTSLWIIRPLSLFASLFKPFIWVLNHTGLLVIRLFGFSASTGKQSIYSEDEIKLILAQSVEGGAIEKAEAEMVYSVLKLGDLPVKQIMIPRTNIIAFEEHTPLETVIKTAEKNLHSRFPVFKNSVDTITGFIHIKDIYRHALKTDKNIHIGQTPFIRSILQIQESHRIDDVLLDMRKKRVHIAVVQDEYGGTAGIVTLEDVLESLVGEIQDEFEIPYKEIQLQKDGSYLIDGIASVESVKAKFNLNLKSDGFTTIGAYIAGELGHDPKEGEQLIIMNLNITIVDVDKNRIKSILVRTVSE